MKKIKFENNLAVSYQQSAASSNLKADGCELITGLSGMNSGW